MSLRYLLQTEAILTPADHHSHRRYPFHLAAGARRLELWVRYAPKRLDEHESLALAERALTEQAAFLAARVSPSIAAQWTADYRPIATRGRIANLLTISLDDAQGTYRGAGHRHLEDQHLAVGLTEASPGLVAGPLVAGEWVLTLSAHTVVSDQCQVAIQIAADIASSR